MTVITIPSHIPAFQQMESTPARALTFATNLRAITVGVKDVQGWAEGIAAPDWAGDTQEAHDHVTTRYAIRLDTVEAALDRVVTGADRFEERLAVLSLLRPPIETERARVNTAAENLRTEIDAASLLGVDAEHLAAFERRGSMLLERATNVTERITDWVTRYLDAESDFIAVLAGVDTVDEGKQAADGQGRVDVDALTDRFNRLEADPVALAAWWGLLSRAQKQALVTEHPGLVGNANGIPARDRDEANRAAMHNDLDYLSARDDDGQLSGQEERALENARHIRDALEKYENSVDPESGRAITNVLVYQPGAHGGDGAVAISFGDPDTADHVSVNIPGLTTEASSTAGNLDKTHALHEAAIADGQGSVATVYWYDYDAPSGNPLKPWELPDFGGVAFTEKADTGGERFGDFIDGLRASDEGPPAHLTAIGHSYGSTTLGHALEDGLAVDDAIVIGSPGVPVATAEGLTDADVWVGSKDYDPVTLLGDGERGGLGALGQDPAEDDFGAHRFETGDGSLRVEDLLDNHTSYFGGTALDNMAHIVTDSDAAVTYQPERGDDGGGYLTLDELVVASSAASAGEFLGGVGGWLLEHSRFGGIL